MGHKSFKVATIEAQSQPDRLPPVQATTDDCNTFTFPNRRVYDLRAFRSRIISKDAQYVYRPLDINKIAPMFLHFFITSLGLECQKIHEIPKRLWSLLAANSS